MKKPRRESDRERYYDEVISFAVNGDLRAAVDRLRGRCSIGEFFRSIIRREHETAVKNKLIVSR
jgi:hypothetical protein